jgi:Zn-dependent protease with chaperone function
MSGCSAAFCKTLSVDVTITLWAPLLVAVAAGLAAGLVQRRLPPPLAARLLTAMAVAAAVAIGWGLVLVAFGYVVQVPWVAERAGWCHRILPSDDRPSTLVGLLSIGALVLGALRMVRAVQRDRSATRALSVGAPAVDILPLAEATAFAVPGRPGHIVVSQPMLDCLDNDEQRVLFAHEQAHLDHHHHRYVRWAELAASTMPLLRPLAAQVRFATERWADEVAADVVGDRGLVARSIAKAALAGAASPPSPLLAMAGLGVPARVEAMLAPTRQHSWLTSAAAASAFTALVITLAGSTVQLHHFIAFAAHVCRI